MSSLRLLRKYAAGSRGARLFALPARGQLAGRHLISQLALTSKWLLNSREHTNFTYELAPLNIEHLAWWTSTVSGAPIQECRDWLCEPLHDEKLHKTIVAQTLASRRRGLADNLIAFGRRLGWYALVRACRPLHVVETGTDKGLGTLLIAAALLRNERGKLTTIDINPASGYLITRPYADVITVLRGDSVPLLRRGVDEVDMFIHDSDHSEIHEYLELQAVEPLLTPSALVLSDNAHAANVLGEWSEVRGRKFLYFDERPANHWYRGAGIGASWTTARD